MDRKIRDAERWTNVQGACRRLRLWIVNRSSIYLSARVMIGKRTFLHC